MLNNFYYLDKILIDKIIDKTIRNTVLINFRDSNDKGLELCGGFSNGW